jgi:hypothetical protein
MWKFVLVLLITALAILVAQLIPDAPVIQTRVGMSAPATPPLMYGGIWLNAA